jgi:hypothetical protein
MSNPQVISTSFDISFNLFNGIIPEIINDYSLISSENEDPFAIHFDTCHELLKDLVEVVSSYRDTHSLSNNTGAISNQLTNGFVGYTLESTEEKQNVKFNLQVYYDYFKRKFFVEMKFSVSDGFNAWHSSIAKALARFDLNESDLEAYYRSGILLIRIGQAELTDLVDCSRNKLSHALQHLMSHFAAESVNPLGFQYNEELFKSNQQKVDSLLDSVAEKIESLLSNKRRAERKIFHQLKYTDCVSMNENYKSQTLRWGVDFNNSQLTPFVAVQLESDTSNVLLTQELMNYAISNDGWKIVSKESLTNDSKGDWSVWNDKGAIITASSSWNRKHGPEQGKLNLEEGIANWSSKANDLKQWIQVDFREKKMFRKVAIQGRYNREQWVTKFRVQVSIDGKKFEEVGSQFQGNVDQHSVVEVALEPNSVARFVRIVPVEWHGHISMRFDIETKDFREQAFEMKKEILVGNLSETEMETGSIADVISDIQNTFKGRFGLKK